LIGDIYPGAEVSERAQMALGTQSTKPLGHKEGAIFMLMCKSIVIAALFVLGTAPLVSPLGQGKGPMTGPETESVPLDRLLHELGRKYDTYFTIEETWTDGKSTDLIRSNLVRRLSKAESLVQELEYLKKAVANLTHSLDQANSRIIHIVDSRLLSQKDYALERVIPSIDFNGPAYLLPDAIARQGVPVSSQEFGFIGQPEVRDYVTVVHVKGEKLKVRDALSGFIPLDRRGNILWAATTKLGPGETSHIAFQGSPKQGAR